MSTAPSPSPSPDGLTTNRVVEPPPEGEASITPISNPPKRTTADYLARRLLLAFQDLGIACEIPIGWVRAESGGLVFGNLTEAQADKLVLAVEDLALGHQAAVASPGPNQLSLF
jgi:hypothetical protein